MVSAFFLSSIYNNVRQRRSIMIIMIISYDFFFLPYIFLFDWLQCAVLCTRISSLRLIHIRSLSHSTVHIHQIVKSYSLITHISHHPEFLSFSISFTLKQWHIFIFRSHTFAFCVILKIMKIYSPSPLLLFRPVSYIFFLYSTRKRGSEHIEKWMKKK